MKGPCIIIALFALLGLASAQGTKPLPASWKPSGKYYGACLQTAGSTPDGKKSICAPAGITYTQPMYAKWVTNATGVYYSFSLDSVTITSNKKNYFLGGFSVPEKKVTGLYDVTSTGGACVSVGTTAIRSWFLTVGGVKVYYEEAYINTANNSPYTTGCPPSNAPLSCNAKIFNYRCVMFQYSGNRI